MNFEINRGVPVIDTLSKLQVVEWFREVVSPEISLNDKNEIYIPSITSVQVINKNKKFLFNHHPFRLVKVRNLLHY